MGGVGTVLWGSGLKLVQILHLCRSRGCSLKLSCATGVAQAFRRVCYPVGRDELSPVISSRFAVRGAGGGEVLVSFFEL